MSDPVAEVLASCAELPAETVRAVFARYGRPLADSSALLDPTVTLGDGLSQVGRLRHRAPVDVIANDHFVLVRTDEETLAMPGPLFAAAIAALTRR